ncbi:MAG TPA: D-glycero-beta-D-manno-heptose-7-phosphate kinase [Gemmatimonadales bacterium]|jgi:D-beta-D-heptose 7-phosphate kinase/D-beta-D-heptose 1-phosphate adenosyltransferase|nr:D-glycero-beta-D-manno-heptose-7-phosphate kinase [Gemmatimonadales bacterium]
MRHTPYPPISRDRILHLLEKLKGRRVVVVGDVMLDRYLIGDTERLSPEAPVPVVTIRERRTALGGAANVAANVVAIGATCQLVGIVGDDPEGRSLRQELAAAQIDDRHVLTVSDRPTTSKTRVMARAQQVVRIDEEIDSLIQGPELERLINLLVDALSDADALLIEDYNKGALTPALIAAALGGARRRGVPVVVDPKFRQFFEYSGATVFKPNRRELESALGAAVDLQHRDALPEALTRLKVDNLLVTLGSDGMVLVTKDGKTAHIPSIAREVYDVSGAGDTVTAWMGTALAAGASVMEGAILANYAAGVEVGKAGVATVSSEEVLAVHDERYDQIGKLRRGGLI